MVHAGRERKAAHLSFFFYSLFPGFPLVGGFMFGTLLCTNSGQISIINPFHALHLFGCRPLFRQNTQWNASFGRYLYWLGLKNKCQLTPSYNTHSKPFTHFNIKKVYYYIKITLSHILTWSCGVPLLRFFLMAE